MVYKKYENSLKSSPHNTYFFLMPDGQIPAPGDVLKQPILANTHRRLAAHGADDFYREKIAEQVAVDMAANEGWITLTDLQSFPDPLESEPLHTTYQGFDVYSQPPPCGGWAVLLALNILENHSVKDLQPDTESRFQKVLQALHLTHLDRKVAPVTDLLNYQNAVSKKLDKQYAVQLLEDYLPPFEM